MINLLENVDIDQLGLQMHGLMTVLYPICRSITGNGLRESLQIIQKYVPLALQEVPTGTQVFDWAVPKEWNVREAYVKNARGDKVIDFKSSNLHLLNYSIPIQERMPLAKLKKHLYSLPEYPDWIPYRTSYYTDNWGFCVEHCLLEQLEDGNYEIYIDTTLEDGYLTFGELYLKGEQEEEVLFSTHICHPSMCNDNLSGVVVNTFLALQLSTLQPLRYSYRFLFIPTTIGAITWLALNEQESNRIKHGLVLASLGDSAHLSYSKSRRGIAEIDQVVEYVLKNSGQEHEILDFLPYGSDSRQFCSPGFDLPVGTLTRSPLGSYPENHTSADDLNFVQPEYLADSLKKCLQIVEILENNRRYFNLHPKCEPQLGKRGLYSAFGGRKDVSQHMLAMLWVLNLSDNMNSLLDIASRSHIPFVVISEAARALVEHGLLIESEY